jgi:glycosyltransferase involved in cell wall biosynthesis
MRILYFSRDYTTHDRRFLVKLAQSSHDVWFLRLEDDGLAYEERHLPEGIHLASWRGGRQRNNTPEAWLRLMPDFESVVDQVRPDLIHAGPVQSCGFMVALAGFHPFLVTSWGSDILVDANRDGLWRWMTCYTLKRSDMLLCDCQAVRLKVQQLVPYADRDIIQFPWGIDLNLFAPGGDSTDLKRRVGWENSFVILSTRAWEQIYGIETLLEAFRQAYSQNSRLRLLLLGNGSLVPRVHQFIADNGLDDLVYCPGMISHEQLPGYFRMADVYLSCSYSDGASISLLEAMATGLPVVVTDGPGNREWVVSGQNGWLETAGDPKAFAQALLRSVDMNPIERAQVSQRNRQVAEERANWDVNFAKLLRAYEEIESRYLHSGNHHSS